MGTKNSDVEQLAVLGRGLSLFHRQDKDLFIADLESPPALFLFASLPPKDSTDQDEEYLIRHKPIKSLNATTCIPFACNVKVFSIPV
ncbi:uncharacterized protein ARMOST_11471 [Armillaria ostoyae]|uniref:Uncharacterized protein n=1 Tax=Armillaria ostoyae TaxID=47428 RepID=A0A284RH78_ARMOS|nr:uncharacterized protein ARMOST_11471 [Armillaria ostoyae]